MFRVVVSACVVVGATVANAEPRRLEITGGACHANALAGDILKLSGEQFVDAARASVHVELVAPSAARVSFDDGDGNVSGPREIAASECGELLASIALVIAMTPSTPVATAAPTPSAEPTLPPTARSEPQPHPTSDALEVGRAFVLTSPQATRWDVLVGGTSRFDTHGVDGVIAAGVRYRRGTRSVSGELQVDVPERDALATGRVDVLRAELAVAPCQHFGSFAACAVIAAGTLRGSGVGLADERAVLAPLVTVGARIAWERQLGRLFAVRATVDGDVLATTTRFDVDSMPVWTSQRVEASAGLSLLARFL
jgi:hypothetical protein